MPTPSLCQKALSSKTFWKQQASGPAGHPRPPRAPVVSLLLQHLARADVSTIPVSLYSLCHEKGASGSRSQYSLGGLLPSIFPNINVFSNELALHIRRPKYCSFSFNISVSNEYSELISFRIDWFALLGVQGALMCLLQHHSSKASVLQCSAFFMVQLWHPYMTTGKTITLSIGTFVSKVMSLLFDTLSRFGIVFFPWASIFYFMTAVSVLKKIVFLRAQENSLSRFSFFPPSISLKWWDRMLWS